MAKSLGKEFEARFKQDWIKTFGEGSIDRIYDAQGGFKAIANISDFIGYSYPYLFYLECKSIQGNTYPIPFRQYDKLLQKKEQKGVFAGIVVWFRDHDKVIFIDVQETERLLGAGYKSININKMVGKEGFEKIVVIPGEKKRTYIQLDLSIMYKYMEERECQQLN